MSLISNPDGLAHSIARICMKEGLNLAVAILTYSQSEIISVDAPPEYDHKDFYILRLHLSSQLFHQLGEIETNKIADLIQSKVELFQDKHESYRIIKTQISPQISEDPEWRNKADGWLKGYSHVSNQGRVRSDNVAKFEQDGLFFRSQPEINLYRALKDQAVLFAPLPTFLIGGKDYLRVEPDFIILYSGMVALIEVDGDAFHRETPAEAHQRTLIFQENGVDIQRFTATECETYEKSKDVAKQIINRLKRIKYSRS